jgi:uncharacterized protein (TIGR01319 family)
VVLAGNADATPAAAAALTARGVPVTTAANVLPRIGDLRPGPARAAIREVFLRHVIGGKGLSRGPRFATLVRGATPDIVLTAVELLADGIPAAGGVTAAGGPVGEGVPGLGELVVVDVGGATTDVYSVLTPDAERSGPRREAAGTLWRSRTVEADLGVRWSAPGIVEAALAERLIDPPEADRLATAAAALAADPSLLPGAGLDVRLAGLAVTVALRRHARGERGADGLRRGGRDLRRVRWVVASGGVLRHAPDGVADRVLAAALADHAGGWPLPAAARRVTDTRYVLAAVGLLAGEYPVAAARLAGAHLAHPWPATRK